MLALAPVLRQYWFNLYSEQNRERPIALPQKNDGKHSWMNRVFMKVTEPPPKQGLYDPQHEHDACGVGFLVNIKGKKSNQIIRQALDILVNLNHRGACGCEKNTGDGAGILFQMPHAFLKEICADARIALPSPGDYGAGMVFLPPDKSERSACEKLFAGIVKEEGQKLLGW